VETPNCGNRINHADESGHGFERREPTEQLASQSPLARERDVRVAKHLDSHVPVELYATSAD
jgi:hypothetical protein